MASLWGLSGSGIWPNFWWTNHASSVQNWWTCYSFRSFLVWSFQICFIFFRKLRRAVSRSALAQAFPSTFPSSAQSTTRPNVAWLDGGFEILFLEDLGRRYPTNRRLEPLLHGKTQGFVLRLPPWNKPHVTVMQPLQCVLQQHVPIHAAISMRFTSTCKVSHHPHTTFHQLLCDVKSHTTVSHHPSSDVKSHNSIYP